MSDVNEQLWRRYDVTFDAIALAFATAVSQRSFGPVEILAELHGLIEQNSNEPSAKRIFVKSEGGLSLMLQLWWYDQSGPFSNQPDINKLRLELREGATVLRMAQDSYED